MKKFKKFASTALALAILATMAMPMVALAAPDETPEEVTAASGALTLDAEVYVGGLQAEDEVKFYQILEWDGAWAVVDDFEAFETELDAIAHGAAMDADLAAAIGRHVANNELTAASEDNIVRSDNGTRVTLKNPAAGLYIAVIKPGVPGYIYNPVFVAADYNPGDNGIVLDDKSLAYPNYGIAKVSVLDVEKTATVDGDNTNTPNTVKVGDVINFEIKTSVPVYGENYIKPVFIVSDTLSAGLTLVEDSIAVDGVNDGNYEFVDPENGATFAISFSDTFLRRAGSEDAPAAAVPVVITYKAVVTSAATTSVTPESNTVDVKFSNDPSNSDSYGLLRDKTNHYSFDINGQLFGNTDYTTTELVKVGVDANGNEINKTEMSNHRWAGVLAGAKFKLYTDAEGKDSYVNGKITAETEFVSDENGRMNIQGLDEGTYYLIETEAPAGFIAAPEAIKIEIEAVVNEYEFTEKENGIDVTYKANVLDSYTVKINGAVTGSYTLTNEGIAQKDDGGYGDVAGDASEDGTDLEASGKIVNKVGVALPSTGGIGTTIFYVVGAILVIGAGVLLVVKKRVGEQD